MLFNINFFLKSDHSLSAYAKISQKLTFLIPRYTHRCAYQGVGKFNFSENFVYVLSQFVVFKPLSYSFKEIVGFELDSTQIWNCNESFGTATDPSKEKVICRKVCITTFKLVLAQSNI